MSDELHTQNPLQKVSWTEKTKKNYEWWKANMDFRINGSYFHAVEVANARTANLQELYDSYNSKFPKKWFTHITDPLSAKDPKHKNFPAKLRPANILAPTINFLYGQYPQRPFDFRVSVKGDDGYNSFMEGKKEQLYKNLSQHFINTANAALEEAGVGGTGVDSKEAEMPEKLMNKFVSSYRDLLSEQAQTDLDLILEDQSVKEKFLDMFKDWLIAGEAYSYKDVVRDQVVYERVNPMNLDWDASPETKYIKDANWVVRREVMTNSDIVDRFYDSLKPGDIDKLEGTASYGSPTAFASHLASRQDCIDGDKNYVYHVVWKGLEQVYELSYPDPITGEIQTDIVSETYVPDKDAGETVKAYWITQVLEGYRIASDTYVEMQPTTYQANRINNLSKHELPYNGRCFSNSNTDNTSILKMGLPFQIMYIINFYILEKTIAKSKGKIVLLDQNTIPRGKGWDEEKFFYFGEATGWGLINRNQTGVDKSYNQYQVLDLGLFDHIQHLIQMMEYCVTQYDRQVGLSPQAKAQVTSGETATGVNAAIGQSALITEMVFTGFDQLVRTDMEGLLNCSQISNIKGKRAVYTNSDMRTKLLEINPDYYCYADFGLMMVDSAAETAQLNRMRQYAQSFAQNGETPEAVLALETANNISTLKNQLAEIKEQQIKLAQQNAASEQEAELDRIELEQSFKEFEKLLDIQEMHEEYDRKLDLVVTQGDINMAIEAGVASLEGGGNAAEYQEQREAAQEDLRLKEKEIDRKMEDDKRKAILEQKKLEAKNRETKMKERVAKSQERIRRAQAKKKK